MNCYEQLDLLRDYVYEAVASHFTDLNLLRRLNVAQRTLALRIAMTAGDWLVKKSVSITPVDSIVTLPTDCSKPIYMEEVTSGYPIGWLAGGVSVRRGSRGVGTSLNIGGGGAYTLADTIEVNQDSFVTPIYLWYQKRVPDLHCGFAVAGEASSLTLDTSTATGTTDLATGRAIKFVDDYYNGSMVEIYNGTGIIDIRSEISDFVASTGKITITGTPAADDQYGTVSQLPEELHMLMVLEAAVISLMKPSAKLDPTSLKAYIDERKDLREEAYAWLDTRVVGAGRAIIGEPY